MSGVQFSSQSSHSLDTLRLLLIAGTNFRANLAGISKTAKIYAR